MYLKLKKENVTWNVLFVTWNSLADWVHSRMDAHIGKRESDCSYPSWFLTWPNQARESKGKRVGTFFPGRFFGQTAWEGSLQEEVWRTFLDKQRSTGKQLQRWRDDRCRFAKWEPYSWAFSKNARALFVSSVEQARVLPHLKQLLLVGFAWSFDASFPAFWDGERARSSRRPASRIVFPERAVSQLGKSAHQKTTPGKRGDLPK